MGRAEGLQKAWERGTAVRCVLGWGGEWGRLESCLSRGLSLSCFLKKMG